MDKNTNIPFVNSTYSDHINTNSNTNTAGSNPGSGSGQQQQNGVNVSFNGGDHVKIERDRSEDKSKVRSLLFLPSVLIQVTAGGE